MERTKARILHVDDHQDTRLMMAALLQDCGYGVLTAGSVAEGLELAREINSTSTFLTSDCRMAPAWSFARKSGPSIPKSPSFIIRPMATRPITRTRCKPAAMPT